MIILLIIIGIFILLCLYGYYQFNNYKIVEEDITLSSVTESFRMVFISDIQLDTHLYRAKRLLNRIIGDVNRLHPDLVVLGGDLIHNENKFNQEVLDIISKIKCKVVIGVLGNHDYYNLPIVKKFYHNHTYQLLMNERFMFNGVSFYGVDDYRNGHPILATEPYDILISHNPDYFEDQSSEVGTYGISGHYHGGQIVLFNKAPGVISPYGQKYRYGWVNHKGFKGYVSSGLGGWVFGLPIRINAQGEIVVWNIKKS